MKINKVVVIGSGTMGSGIAAHLCNANVPVVLLDLKTEIAEKAKAGKFPSLTSMKQDGPIVTMEYLFEKSSAPRFSLVSRYDGEFWFSARLDGKDIVAN